MDRLTSLTVFTRVAEYGGFSAVARRLNMSPTMVSNHVQALEDRLGARLLNRTTRKVSLTEVGRAYYERCVQILAELEEADEAVGELQTTPRGTLRLYSSTHIMRLVAPVVGEFLRLNAEASVELSIGERMVDLVEEGYDLAVRTLPPPDSSLIVRQLTRWHHVLVCAPSYLERYDPPRVPADLLRHNCLHYTYYPFDDGWHFTDKDGREISVRISGNLRASSGDLLRIVTLAGQGIMLAPGFLAGADLQAGRLVPIMTDYQPAEFAINAIYPHRRHLSAKVRSFIDLLAKHIVDERQWLKPDFWA